MPGKNSGAVFNPSALQSALMASFPVLVIVVISPALIYAGNQPYFDNRYDVILDLSLIYAVVLTLLYLLFRLLPWFRKPVSYPLAVIGMLLCAVSLIAPSPVAELLRGRIGEIRTEWTWSMFDAGTLLLLWVLVRFAPEQTLVRVSSLFCVLLAVAVPAGVVFEAAGAQNSVTSWLRDRKTESGAVGDLPNVYHFIFDGFEGSLFGRIISDLDLVPSFDGFVWHSNAYSNYTSTRLSLPSSMTGKLFDEETIDDDAAVRIGQTEGLVKILASIGYSVTQYNAYFINNHRLATNRNSTASIEEETYGGLRHLVQLLDLSLLLSVPQVIKEYTAIGGRGLFGHAFLRTERSVADWSRNPPLLSLMLFSRLLKDEPARPDRGQYVNGHFLIPHPPFVMSADCKYEPSRDSTQLSLIDQHICTVNRLAEFFDILRKLGRFEDSMILVQSDHGWLRRQRPLLLVKYPGRKNQPLTVVDYPVQLVDVAPTFLNELGIDYSEMDGIPLKNNDPELRSEIKIWIANPSGS